MNKTQPLRRITTLLLQTGVCIFFSVVQADASAVYSIVTNPGEDCSVEMNVGWHAELRQTNCLVTYTKNSDTNWAHATKVGGTFERSDIFNGIFSKTPAGADTHEDAVFLDYGVTLARLERQTDYMYKVCAASDDCSDVHYFKTAGSAEFSFVWISDIHCYTPLPKRMINAAKVLKAAGTTDPDVSFVFSTGDVVAWGGSYSFWKNLYEQDFAKNYMYAGVLGNHDNMMRKGGGKSDFFRVASNYPRNGYAGQEGVCYWFSYNDVLFFTFNNEAMYKNPAEQKAAQDWASGVIHRLKGKYRYIFIAEHYQWFDGRKGATSWYANWKDFCDEHHVALALSGNNHIYERTHPLLHDQVVAEGMGTVYMEAPSSDGERG
ncbi:MAG: metallophosphoesterase, partial [Limisphaerales bacterium]